MTDRHIKIAGDANGSVVVVGDHNVVRVVIAQTRTFARPLEGANPYRGLQTFEERHALGFFGREQVTDSLWEAGAELLTRRQTRLLAVLGRSGSGKSSVVRAGLLPALGRRPWPETDLVGAAVFEPGDDPLAALDAAVRRAAQAVADRAATQRRLVLVADQFESLFTGRSDAETRQAFVRALLDLAQAPDGETFVIITIRSDFLGALQDYPELERLIAGPRHHRIVAGMSREELRDAIAGPMPKDRPLPDALVGRLVEQAHGREGALPLLEYTLTQIWEGMTRGLEPEDYFERRLEGSIAKAIATEADRLFDELGDDRRKSIARRAFSRMVELHEQSLVRRPATIRSLVGPGETAGEVLDVLRHFAERRARVVTLAGALGGEQEADHVVASVAHEALIANWPMLRVLVTSDPEDRRFHRRLTEDVDFWHEAGHPSGSLWRPPNLELLRAFANRRRGEMTATELAFFQASEDAWQAEQDSGRRRARLTQAAAVLMTGLAITAAGLFWYARQQGQESERQADAARTAARKGSLVLAQLAERELEGGRGRSATLLAAEALPPDPANAPALIVPNVSSALVSGLASPFEKNRLAHGDKVSFVAFSADDKSVITGFAATSDDQGSARRGDRKITVRFWDPETGALERAHVLTSDQQFAEIAFAQNGEWALLGDHGGVWRWRMLDSGWANLDDSGYQALAFSPDGRYFSATSSKGKSLKVAQTSDAKLVREVTDTSCDFLAAAFDHANEQMASSCRDGTVRVWRLSDAEGKPFVLRGAAFVGSTMVTTKAPLVFSRDGSRLAAGFDDGRIKVWRAADGAWKESAGSDIGKPHPRVTALAFSSDDVRIAAGHADGTIRIWEPANAYFVQVLGGHAGPVEAVAFNRAGTRLASASADHSARIWELPQRGPQRELVVEGGYVHRVVFSPDGKAVATLSFGNDASVWKIEGETASKLDRRLSLEGLGPLAFSSDGRRLIGSRNISGLESLDIDQGRRAWLSRFSSNAASVESLAVSRDERWLAIGSPQGYGKWTATVEIWNMRDEKPVRVFETFDAIATGALAFDATGTSLFAGYHDGVVRQWLVAPDRTPEAWPSQPARSFEGHRGPIAAIAVAPDGQRLATAARDGTLRVWDIATGELTGYLASPMELIEAVRFVGDTIEYATLVDKKYIRLRRERPSSTAAAELGSSVQRLQLCPLDDCERRQFGLSQSPSKAYPPPHWTARQRQACGIREASTVPPLCFDKRL